MLPQLLQHAFSPRIVFFILAIVTSPGWVEDQPEMEQPSHSEHVGQEASTQDAVQKRGIQNLGIGPSPWIMP